MYVIVKLIGIYFNFCKPKIDPFKFI